MQSVSLRHSWRRRPLKHSMKAFRSDLPSSPSSAVIVLMVHAGRLRSRHLLPCENDSRSSENLLRFLRLSPLKADPTSAWPYSKGARQHSLSNSASKTNSITTYRFRSGSPCL